MKHILKKTSEELHITHEEQEKYKILSLREWIEHIFGKSFKQKLFLYAQKKEEILLEYSSLYSDFLKDINDSKAKASDIQDIQKSLEYITQTIGDCGNILESMILCVRNPLQETILSHEKIFFFQLLECFHHDLVLWTQKHEQEIFGEISKLDSQEKNTSLASGKALLELQKKRLESHLNDISHLENYDTK